MVSYVEVLVSSAAQPAVENAAATKRTMAIMITRWRNPLDRSSMARMVSLAVTTLATPGCVRKAAASSSTRSGRVSVGLTRNEAGSRSGVITSTNSGESPKRSWTSA